MCLVNLTGFVWRDIKGQPRTTRNCFNSLIVTVCLSFELSSSLLGPSFVSSGEEAFSDYDLAECVKSAFVGIILYNLY